MADVTYNQLVSHFRGLSKAARALGLDRRQVHNWSKRRIPSKWQLKVELMSSGRLRADRASRLEAEEFAIYLEREAA